MKFFLDTADTALIRELNDVGIVDGITTNPTLIKRSGRDHKEVVQEISKMVEGPISVETLGESAEEMIREADEYVQWGTNIVIKIVMTSEGMKAVKKLSARGIKTNVTLIFSPMQALLAAKAGATYVSPFVGRLDDIGQNGMEIIYEIREMFDRYAFETQILSASLRHPNHVFESAKAGADVATIPPKVVAQLFKHPLTDKGIEVFLADSREWAKA